MYMVSLLSWYRHVRILIGLLHSQVYVNNYMYIHVVIIIAGNNMYIHVVIIIAGNNMYIHVVIIIAGNRLVLQVT